MGTKEEFVQAFHNAPSEEDQEKFEQHLKNHDETSHQSFFEGRMLKQRIRRQDELAKAIGESMGNQRLAGAHGDQIVKVTFNEFRKLMKEYIDYDKEGRGHQSDFQPFSRYAPNLLQYSDGRPRPQPLRPLLQNEVGMLRGKIVVLRDAGPDDYGEGKYFQVPSNAPVASPTCDIHLVDTDDKEE